jgi:hypothetical protein
VVCAATIGSRVGYCDESGKPADEFTMVGESASFQNGMTLSLSRIPHVTSRDSIWIEFELKNDEYAPVVFRLAEKTGSPRIILSSEKSAPLTRPIRLADCDEHAVNRTPPPTKAAVRGRVDIRRIFGSLETG